MQNPNVNLTVKIKKASRKIKDYRTHVRHGKHFKTHKGSHTKTSEAILKEVKVIHFKREML